jgi:hypothetical protein
MGRGRARKTTELIDAICEILDEVQPCSVRAICYQLFNRKLIESMDKRETNRVGQLLTEERERGAIPWTSIVQEGRALEGFPGFDDPAHWVRAMQGSYWRNKWTQQPKRIIVVSEKGTVRGTLGPVLDRYDVQFLAVGGYASATRVRELAQMRDPLQPLLLAYLGDHDPSGRGMSDEDLPGRLFRYAGNDPSNRSLDRLVTEYDLLAECGLELKRIALTEADTRELGRPLSFPASDKRNDSRYAWYVERYGARCWELDAMNPNALRARVQAAIEAEIEPVAWERYVRAEREESEAILRHLEALKSISGLA